MRDLKWYHFAGVALGLFFVLYIVYLFLTDEDIKEKLKGRKIRMVEDETDLVA